nr:hypothetical protein [Sphingomonas sp.]
MSHTTLHEFIRELEDSGTRYALTSVRDGAVMVQVMLPDERWEVQFFEDREPEVEIFRSDGTIFGLERMNDLATKETD